VVYCDEVLSKERALIQIVIGSHIQLSNPSLINFNDGKPSAPWAVDVEDDKEDKLEKLQRVLGVFTHIQSGNDPRKSCNSEKLEQTKHGKSLVLRLRNQVKQVIERHSWQEVNGESAFEIVISYDFEVFDLVTCDWMVESRSEGYEDVDAKEQVNDRVQHHKVSSCQLWWREWKFERNEEWVVQSQYDDEELPSCLARVILGDHELLVLLAEDVAKCSAVPSNWVADLLEPPVLGLHLCFLQLSLGFFTLLLLKVFEKCEFGVDWSWVKVIFTPAAVVLLHLLFEAQVVLADWDHNFLLDWQRFKRFAGGVLKHKRLVGLVEKMTLLAHIIFDLHIIVDSSVRLTRMTAWWSIVAVLLPTLSLLEMEDLFRFHMLIRTLVKLQRLVWHLHGLMQLKLLFLGVLIELFLVVQYLLKLKIQFFSR
jgi:hypothetical protein